MSNPSKANLEHDRKETRLEAFLGEHFPDEPLDDAEAAAFKLLGEYKEALDMLLDWPPSRDIGWDKKPGSAGS